MKRILAVSILILGLAGCTAREQQLVAVGVVGALAGTIVANGMSESNRRPYYQHHPYYHPRPVPNPYAYHAPRRPQCYITWDRTPYGLRERRVCR